jgi:hypothetical protein
VNVTDEPSVALTSDDDVVTWKEAACAIVAKLKKITQTV